MIQKKSKKMPKMETNQRRTVRILFSLQYWHIVPAF